MKNLLQNALRSFHNDEDGMEAIQVVLILAIAAVALLVVKGKWDGIKSFFNENVDQAAEWSA